MYCETGGQLLRHRSGFDQHVKACAECREEHVENLTIQRAAATRSRARGGTDALIFAVNETTLEAEARTARIQRTRGAE